MKSGKQTNKIKGKDTNLSYFALRRIIGITGILLPIICILVAWKIEPSISHYYYTRSGVFFIGVLMICGVFLISYRGEEWEKERLSTYIITWGAGVLIIAVAVIPTTFSEEIPCDCGTSLICHCDTLWGNIHLGSAAAFFFSMGFLSIFRFPKGIRPFQRSKIRRNRVYIGLGIAMWVVLVITGILMKKVDDKLPDSFVLIVEIVLLALFATSWLIKGKALVYLPWVKDDNDV